MGSAEASDTSMSMQRLALNTRRTTTLIENFGQVLDHVAATRTGTPTVRLVAVSKLKPANDILALHQPPHNHLYFGENYAQELESKAEILPKEIRWCFIGALQTNKCKALARDVSNLWCVSSVDSEKKADELDKGRKMALEKNESIGKLRVHIQVNTSGESEKSGVSLEQTAALCRHVIETCSNLHFAGLMTIGAIARSQASSDGAENQDFSCLKQVRDTVREELGLQQGEIELSMGMSEDYAAAIRCGSDEVRIGSKIFGERPAKKDAKIKVDAEEE